MKFTVLLCLVGLVVAVSADCTIKDKTYKVGESWTPEGSCILQTCDGENSFNAKGCASQAVENPSEWTFIAEDVSKDYPACCSHYEKKQ